MSITWEMISVVVSLLVAMFAGFKWLARKFDRVVDKIGKIDKKKVSHKVCAQRRAECPCKQTTTERIGK